MSISITQTISRAFIFGTLILLAVNWIIFRSAILITENTVNTKRLNEVSEYHLNYYRDGGKGTKQVDSLTISYDEFASLPNIIQTHLPESWLGAQSMHFDEDDSEYVIVAKKIDKQTYYLVENSRASEWSDDVFLMIELAVIAGGLFLVLCARFYIVAAANKISLPFRSLAKQLDSDEAKSFEALTVEGHATIELKQTVTAINDYRQSIARSITREKSFTRYVSHELRTPMTVIKGATSLLNRLENEKVSIQTSRISKAVDDMNELTQTLLLLARESNDDDGEIVVDDKLIEQELHDIDTYIQSNECQVDYQILSAFRLPVQPTLFKTLFKNLLINAVNSTAKGQVSIFLDENQLSIIDNGIGLEAQSRGYQGFGIGLVIVEDICQKYGWQFSLVNNDTQGCTAKVTFH
ncbi:sensor histidine kinase [Thalassotalea eurytherma]|uniref:histidine kinase n=1 Tax=Thalassotalea eurytherma TaxID=1144278 RepID=A0ABQ6H7U2_9GAMM|nr:HAMP domain-containing sensor histidine kinase [Thalassotalea eurytherma]GLX83574.1 two-component sensor histidine kinase [Thalassotalea eurytherma]